MTLAARTGGDTAAVGVAAVMASVSVTGINALGSWRAAASSVDPVCSYFRQVS